MIFFNKMHGTGNDFIIIDCIKQKFNYSYSILSKFLCDRNIGIGADGVIYVLRSNTANYKMRIFNKDGTEAEMCGNGIRCVGKYIYENIEQKEVLKIETNSGIKELKLFIQNNIVRNISVDLGKVIIEPNKIPVFLPENQIEPDLNSVKIEIDKEEIEAYVVSIGNPHAICFEENIDLIDIKKYGSIIENYKYFPHKTNVEFVQVIDKKNIKVRVWERGVGETNSCGTGAACSSFVAIKKFNLNNNIIVELKGGSLQVLIKEDNTAILTGSAENVFRGEIDL